jgi:LmbE family N-acetylglucosaminyl deacetylase
MLQARLTPMTLTYPAGKRLLVLAAEQHQDIIGCGGIIQNALAAGCEIQAVYLSDGAPLDLGEDSRTEAVQRMDDAARQAWYALGGNAPVCWDTPDDRLSKDEAAIERIVETIKDFKPDCLFVPSFFERGPGLRQVSEWLRAAHDRRRLPKLEIWAYQVAGAIFPNVVVDITEVEPRKNELLRFAASEDGRLDHAHLTRGLNAANSQIMNGRTGGRSLSYELFFVVQLKQYLDLLTHYDSTVER